MANLSFLSWRRCDLFFKVHGSTNSCFVFAWLICTLTPRSAISKLWYWKELTHLVMPDGAQANPDKLRAISHYPLPADLKAVRSFLGLSTYLQNRITEVKNYASFISEAFFLLKSAGTSPPELGIFVESACTKRRRYTSGYVVGAVLGESQSLNRIKPVVTYGNPKLSKCEKRNCTIEKEWLDLGYIYFLFSIILAF